jgi:RNA polymerase sigma-70 factor (ECF subfamily)
VLVSDGVHDAGISQGEPFGEVRLAQAIAEVPPADVPVNVYRRVLRHLDGQPPQDDLSVVVVWRGGAASSCGTGGSLREREPADPWTLLLLRAQAGDTAALGQLLDAVRPTLYRRLLAKLRNVEDVLEVIQETALRTLSSLSSFDAARGSAGAYLFTIADRLAADVGRRRARARLVRLDDHTVEPGDDTPGPEQIAETREMEEEVRRAVELLPPKLREAVTLHFLQGKSYRQLADEVLHVPWQTAGSRVHRALRQLHRYLAPRFGRAVRDHGRRRREVA